MFLTPFSDVGGVVFTPRIERPPLHRGGSASKENGLPAPSHSSETARGANTGNHQAPHLSLFSSFVFPRIGESGQGCPRLRASNEHILMVRVLRAKRAPGCILLPLHNPAPATGGKATISMAPLRISTMRLSSGSDVLSGGMRIITLERKNWDILRF